MPSALTDSDASVKKGARPSDLKTGVEKRWWNAYREVFRSSETIATFIGLAFLIAGWGMAWADVTLNRYCYLAGAVVAGLPILKTCAESLLARSISVEVLVALAIVASLFAGEYQAGAVVAVMLLGGGILEQITIARARNSLAGLLSNIPKTALVRRGEVDVEVSVSELRIRDHVVTRPGERIAVDGMVVAGESAVDESPITGESVPQDKTIGARVFAGTINQSGMLEVEAQKVGNETTLARILRLVEEAQASQAPIQRLADKAAQWYVPTALTAAAIIWALTGEVMRGITVLIVFCPCALVLATPTAIVASIGKAARRMILIKGGQYAEAVGQVHIVAFDKTGTLTMGRPVMAEIVAFDSLTPKELLRTAASAERFSEHPLGVAICRAAEEQQLQLSEPTGFRSVAGSGVEAQVERQRVLVGRATWLEQRSISLTPNGKQRATDLEASGHTVLTLACNERPVGLFAFWDVLRPEAREAVARLKDQNLRLVMLTGDNEPVAQAIATEVGIGEFHAGLLPVEKLSRVREWQSQGCRVAFVGDGINDAPALAAADIGIAMGVAGTDVALETADIAFLSDDLTRMPEIVDLSRRTLRVIWQNIGFSIGLNIASVAAAGFGVISPIGGAIIHEAGALAVIINAIRLLR